MKSAFLFTSRNHFLFNETGTSGPATLQKRHFLACVVNVGTVDTHVSPHSRKVSLKFLATALGETYFPSCMLSVSSETLINTRVAKGKTVHCFSCKRKFTSATWLSDYTSLT